MNRTFFTRRLLPGAAFCLLAAALLLFAAELVRPPRGSFGSTWRSYLAEPEDSLDVLYLGSSLAYCDFDPVEVYRQSGLTGYVVSGSAQTMSLTYWYLREALETQHPQAVVLEGSGVFFPRYENYTQVNVAYMPFSLNKLGAIFTAAEPELRGGLLWDLQLYHSRWKELKLKDLQRVLTPAEPDVWKGFTPIYTSARHLAPMENSRQLPPEQYQENLSWLLRCLALCRERGIRAAVVINPSFRRAAPEQYRQLEADLAESGCVFHNWVEQVDSFSLKTDFYDKEHLNLYGAAAYARDLGALLTEELGAVPREQTAENRAAWQAALAQRDPA